MKRINKFKRYNISLIIYTFSTIYDKIINNKLIKSRDKNMKVNFDKTIPAKEMTLKLYEKEFEIEFPTQCYHENSLKEATECSDLTKIIDEIKKTSFS